LAGAPHQLPWVGFINFLCDAISWNIVLYLNQLDKKKPSSMQAATVLSYCII
jgi:hypothetical protein